MFRKSSQEFNVQNLYAKLPKMAGKKRQQLTGGICRFTAGANWGVIAWKTV